VRAQDLGLDDSEFWYQTVLVSGRGQTAGTTSAAFICSYHSRRARRVRFVAILEGSLDGQRILIENVFDFLIAEEKTTS
jgi:hypothetical protein